MPACPPEPAHLAVLNDKYVRKNIDCVIPYLLGQGNQARRIRDLGEVLNKYVELGVPIWSYLGLFLRLILLAVNATAIFFAFLTYARPKSEKWDFELPSRIVVWIEFIGIAYYLAWVIWRLIRLMWASIRELRSRGDNVYRRNLELCDAVRMTYNSVMKLEFNLLMFLRYVSPPAVVAALAKARRKVYGRYGTRVHRQACCVDLCCCCCFYGRLFFCSLFQGMLVLVCVGTALLAVLIKVLQLRFLGTVHIREWNITELLLFGQFVINMAYLDTRQQSRRKAKLELLFNGADSDETTPERAAKKLVENLALLVMRYRYSLFKALVTHHSITSEDISFLYVHDELEEDKPRNSVRHEFQKDSGNSAGAPPPPDWPHQKPGYPGAGSYVDTRPKAVHPGQVVVEISPHWPAGPRTSTHGEAHASPVAPQERFPYDFYTHGRAVGAPLRGSPAPDLKSVYEQNLWGGQMP